MPPYSQKNKGSSQYQNQQLFHQIKLHWHSSSQFINTFLSITHLIFSSACKIVRKDTFIINLHKEIEAKRVMLLVQGHVTRKFRSQCSNPSLLRIDLKLLTIMIRSHSNLLSQSAVVCALIFVATFLLFLNMRKSFEVLWFCLRLHEYTLNSVFCKM